MAPKTSETRPVFQAEDAPADPSIPESIRLLAENVAKNRKRLIEDLKRATTAEAKEEAAKALRKALGGDAEGKSLSPKALSDLVENLKKAESATDKDAAAKALGDALSPDGKGQELTPKVLHDSVKALKEAATEESRETAARNLLKTLGPDGLQVFNKNGSIDKEAMAAALTLDKTKDSQAFAALGKTANDERLPLTPGPLQGGNPETPVPPSIGTTPADPNQLGPNVDLGNVNGNEGLGGGVAGLNDEPVVQEDLNEDLRRALERAQEDLERERENNRNNQNRNRGAGVKKDDNQQTPSPLGGGSGGGSGGGGSGAGEPMPPGTPQKLEPFAAFQAPQPSGQEVNLGQQIADAGRIGGDDKKWDPTNSILNDVAANGAKQIEIAKLKGFTQEMMIASGIDPAARGNGKLSVQRTGGGGGFDNSIASRRQGMQLERTGGKPRTYKRRDGASGPVIASDSRVSTKPSSFRTFAKVGTSAGGPKPAAKRRGFKPRGRSIR